MADQFISRQYSSPNVAEKGILEETFFERLINDAEKGRRHLLLLGGQPGIGKRRTVGEIRRLCSAHDIGFLQGRCVSELKPPLDPFLQIVRGYFATTSKSIGDIMGQSRVLNALLGERGFRAIEIEDPNRPFLDENVVHRSFLSFFRKVASRKALVCFLEDLQWLDEGSMRLLLYLAARLRNEKLLILGTYTDNELQLPERKTADFRQFRADLARNPEILDLALEPLNFSACKELIKNILEVPSVPDTYIKGLQERCGGNPLYMIESLKYLMAYGRIDLGNRIFKGDPDHLRKLPETLFDTIIDSAVTIPETQKELYRTAACMGMTFSFELLWMALGKIPEESLRDMLEKGRRQGFIYSENYSGEERFVFSHPLVRHVFYDLVAQQDRKELHGRIGTIIEEIYFDNLSDHYEELVLHFTRALDDDRTIRYLIRAADKSALRGAHSQGIELYQQALALMVGSLEKSKEIWKCCRTIGVLHARTGNQQMALEFQKKALDMAEKKMDTLAIQECLVLIADLYLAEGDRKRALAMVEKGLAFETMKDSLWRARLLSRKGAIARLYKYKERTFEDALTDLKEALEIARELRNIDATIEMSELLADHYSDQNMVEEAERFLGKTLSYRTDIRTRLHLLQKLGSLAMFPGSDYKKALSLFLEGLRSASEHDEEDSVALFANYLGSLYCEIGDPRKSERYLKKALTAAGGYEMEAETRLLMGKLAFCRGIFRKARRHCREAEKLLEGKESERLSAEIELILGNCSLLEDDLETAQEHFMRAQKRAEQGDFFKGAFFALLGRSMIYLREGNLFSARRLFVEASHRNKRGENRFGKACLMYLQGIGFRLDNNASMALTLLSRAQEYLERLGRPFELGFVCLEMGRAYHGADGKDDDAAMKCFLKAEECFLTMGNAFMAERVREEIGKQ
jgi:predicted ATPase